LPPAGQARRGRYAGGGLARRASDRLTIAATMLALERGVDRYDSWSYHQAMATTKIAITIEEETVRKVDELVAREVYPSRSKAIQEAVADKLARLSRSRLAEQCAFLDVGEEQALAEEFSPEELEQWRQC